MNEVSGIAELVSPTVNFGLLVLALFFFTRKPVKSMLALRHATIKNQIEEAKRMRDEAQKVLAEYALKISSFENESKSILEKTENEAKLMRQRLVQEARRTAERIVSDAKLTADSNLAEFREALRKETIAHAMAEAEKIIKQKLSAAEQKRILEEYVGKV